MKKKWRYLLAVCCLALSLTACGNLTREPTVSPAQNVKNTFRVYGHDTLVTVDTTGGWSAEVTEDTIILYDKVNDGSREPVATGRVLTQAEYESMLQENRNDSTFAPVTQGVKFTQKSGGGAYLFPVDNGAYFLISARFGAGAEAVFSRFHVVGATELPARRDGTYLTLVNRLHAVPDNWLDAVETVRVTNSRGDEVEVEAQTYLAYLRLEQALKEQGVRIQIRSGCRSAEEQQAMYEEYLKTYGLEYTFKTVAAPGYSENHTGLALDLYLIVDGSDVYRDEDLRQQTELWDTVHASLADYGFILRHQKQKEQITGYAYDPWHIRYVGDAAVARQIAEEELTLEEYVGEASGEKIAPELGESRVFGEMRRFNAAVLVKCRFSTFEDCTLQNVRYAGDGANSVANVEWLSEIAGVEFQQVTVFLTDFHAGKNAPNQLERDRDYKDVPWWLGRTENGDWQLVCWGVVPSAEGGTAIIG